jgi:hypothetical protein
LIDKFKYKQNHRLYQGSSLFPLSLCVCSPDVTFRLKASILLLLCCFCVYSSFFLYKWLFTHVLFLILSFSGCVYSTFYTFFLLFSCFLNVCTSF